MSPTTMRLNFEQKLQTHAVTMFCINTKIVKNRYTRHPNKFLIYLRCITLSSYVKFKYLIALTNKTQRV